MSLFSLLSPTELAFAFVVALTAGTVKGVVGFGVPMILMSGLSIFLPPELALAGLILAAMASNGMLALREGPRKAWVSVQRFRVFLLVGLMFLLFSAQLVRLLPTQALLLVVGLPITAFALFQLLGAGFHLEKPSSRLEAIVGAVAGFIGGLSGVWGPPTVAYLTALGTPKGEQVRVQGVIYSLGSVALLIAHTGSGVLRRETLPLSLALLLPVMFGMWIGTRWHDRIDQTTFRKVTLLVLVVAGLNLVRRGLTG